MDDLDILLDVLGNDTRRRILQLLADEPRYFIQLSKDLGVSQQAVLKHLEILERHGFISSYESESEYAAPKRKYFRLNKSCMLAIGITKDAVDFVFRDIPSQHEKEDNELDRELKLLHRQVTELEEIQDPTEQLNASDELLREINSRLGKLMQQEVSLLTFRQRINKVAHEAIRNSFDQDLYRQILYQTLGEAKQPDVDELSAILDTREKEISSALKVLRQRLSAISR